ncbi:hypothetical protein BDV95DRAFT_175471 [Massariosphaeria phaeospora]|uniref:Uncharacterized protein n=1 Tax=Massariosphaeria phaeospora TaxID=100035 RepID=A0A7C8MEY5_9PLEO|nr:hypothetical protein BDV95DRAFT_175471 [Massariosphaeria phaeospora]
MKIFLLLLVAAAWTAEVVAVAVPAVPFNVSSTDLKSFDNTLVAKRGLKRVSVTMGNAHVNVGEITGRPLFDGIKACLVEICPQHVNECGNKATKFKHKDGCPMKGDITYIAKGEVLDTGGILDVRVASAKWPLGHYALREALIDQVAGTFQVMSEDMKNCFKINVRFRNSNKYDDRTKCCIGEYVDVVVEGWGEDVYMRAFVRLRQRNWSGGVFDCVAIKGATAKYWRENTHIRFADALGVDFDVDPICPNTQVTWGDDPRLY